MHGGPDFDPNLAASGIYIRQSRQHSRDVSLYYLQRIMPNPRSLTERPSARPAEARNVSLRRPQMTMHGVERSRGASFSTPALDLRPDARIELCESGRNLGVSCDARAVAHD